MVLRFMSSTGLLVPKKQLNGQKKNIKKVFKNINKKVNKCVK